MAVGAVSCVDKTPFSFLPIALRYRQADPRLAKGQTVAEREVSDRSKALQARARLQAEEAVKVWAERADEVRATDEKTNRLKALRLEREQAEAEAAAAVAAAKPAKKPAARVKKVKA
jgi:hypothetical protein